MNYVLILNRNFHMKQFAFIILAIFLLVSCNGNKIEDNGLDWEFYLKKSKGTSLKILCTLQDPNEFNYLKNKLKPLLKDSFGINALIYYIPKDRIVKTLLDDSKRSNKVVYDIVVTDPDILQSLFSLGLLYGKYLNTLPNNKELDYTYINSLIPYPGLRDYVVPYSCTQFIMLYDSCDVSDQINLSNIDLSKTVILSSEYNIGNLYYLYINSSISNNQVTINNANKKSATIDSVNLLFKSLIYNPKDFLKLYTNDKVNAAILKNSQALNLINNKIPDSKLKSLNNEFPVYYKMAGITNTSTNVISSMVVINQMISTSYQLDKYLKTFEDDLPIINLSILQDLNSKDSSIYQHKLNSLTRSKKCFSINDITEANKWWKEFNVVKSK